MPERFDAIIVGAGQAGPPLAGRLTWSDADHGWVADWALEEGGTVHRWSVRGVSFDDAFRTALRGAARILSGSGEPQ